MATGCKITVLKCNYDRDIAPEWVESACQAMHVGDVYHTRGSHGDQMPAGFCYMAWESIRTLAVTLASGGKVFGKYDSYVASCPNGSRTTIFLLEAE